jgi:DNA polymerase-3 subunit epsilon
LYAVVDIETTGNYSAGHRIIEIAVIVLNETGNEIDRFDTLLNPGVPIPRFIENLTGISDIDVKFKPRFHEIADKLYSILKDCIFVAHNVSFDFNFLKHEFQLCGKSLEAKKLCTVKLGRKIYAGLKSYSLQNLASALGIANFNAHRAMSDCEATAQIFKLYLENDTNKAIDDALKNKTSQRFLPAQIDESILDTLPEAPGVYYFKNEKAEYIYIGKAVNIKKRVISHFTGFDVGQKRQSFINSIVDIEFKLTGNDFLAWLVEDNEIKKYWPKFNKAQKFNEIYWAVFLYQNQKNEIKTAIKKVSKDNHFPYKFKTMQEAQSFIKLLKINDFNINKVIEKLSHSQITTDLDSFQLMSIKKDRYLIKTKGRSFDEICFILFEGNNIKGYQFVNELFGNFNEDYLIKLENSGNIAKYFQQLLQSSKIFAGKYEIIMLKTESVVTLH